MSPIKVFISHASEDKERFVMPFAKRLRDNGIDAWVDKWEMLPGDSLVDKIFEEGIKDANAVIIVLSSISVTKKWVKEEINAAFISRINKSSKLIPVIIDECEIPACLQTTLWEKINDIDSYEDEYKRIELAILGKNDKPALGNRPKYIDESIENISGLAEIDSLVFKMICGIVYANKQPFLMARQVFESGADIDLSSDIIIESLEILENNGFIEVTHMMQPEMNSLKVTVHSLDLYNQYYNADYKKQIKLIASLIVNNGNTDNETISANANVELFQVDTILDILGGKNLIKNTRFLGGRSMITNISVELKRLMRS
jgi:hypothetical protein